MKQLTLASNDFERFGKTTRWAAFRPRWSTQCRGASCARWSNRCIRLGESGQSSISLERILRIYSRQQWFNLFASRRARHQGQLGRVR